VSIAENLARVRERIEAAARRCGRDPAGIALMAVTKTVPSDRIREAYDSGQRLFGENRVQEFAAKSAALLPLPGVEWHMIGHLQSNKAKKTAELFAAVDSVDSLSLAEKLNAVAQALGKRLPVLIEVNIGGEGAKSGVAPDSPELEELLQAAARIENLEFRGLMSVPPFTAEPEDARHYFRRLRELRDRLAARHRAGVSLDVLSMGMSHDFEVAIEEGATCVRVGTALFGKRKKA
jgi:pyridoxal phosphate enzyme (YggS family)